MNADDLLCFYKGVIRPKLEYATPVFVTSKQKPDRGIRTTLKGSILQIIFTTCTYKKSLGLSKLETLNNRRLQLAKLFFHRMEEETNIIHHLLPNKKPELYELRHIHRLPVPIYM